MNVSFEGVVAKLESWLEGLVDSLPNVVAALVVVIAFAMIGKILGRTTAGVLSKVSSNRAVNDLVGKLVQAVTVLTGLFLALGVLGLDKTVTSLLAGAGIVGLVVGFAFQDAIANLLSGVMLSIRRPIAIGELVETNDHMGTIDEMNLRSTVVRTLDGQLVFIPNKDVFQNPIVNYSRLPSRRVDVGCGVSYGDDLETAKRVVLDAISGVEGRLDDREPEVYFGEFGDSSINFVARFWIRFRNQKDYLAARSDAVMAIKAAIDREGLTIPFPIRTLDFGIVGGEKLSEQIGVRDGRAGDGEGADGG